MASQIRYAILATSIALAWTGCGGGGGGSSTAPTPAIDSDPTLSPAADSGYYGVPSTTLGAVVSGSNVTFTYWNPTASSVVVNLYAKWDDALSSPARILALTKASAGVWSSGPVALPAQNYYVYNVGGTLVLDPYARSMAQWRHASTTGITGDSIGKGAILDPSLALPDGGAWTPYHGASFYFDGTAMLAPDGTTPAPYQYAGNRDAIIYEAGVRDLTVDPALTSTATFPRSSRRKEAQTSPAEIMSLLTSAATQ